MPGPVDLTRMKESLRDRYGRELSYLRLAVTARCNLHCTYCRPPGSPVTPVRDPDADMLVRLVRIMTAAGIRKVRITGGEPLVRRDLAPLLARMRDAAPDTAFHLTTNGVLLADAMDELAAIGLAGVNVSVDAADRRAYAAITGRDRLPGVLNGIEAALSHGVPVKINCVVLKENEPYLEELARLALCWPVSVRFIEAMPFDGRSIAGPRIPLKPVADRLVHRLGGVPGRGEHGTAVRCDIPGAAGDIGFIYAYSRTFCGHCNRVRITPDGGLQLCLYHEPMLNLFDRLRQEPDDTQVLHAIRSAILQKPRDGREAHAMADGRQYPSMARIGG